MRPNMSFFGEPETVRGVAVTLVGVEITESSLTTPLSRQLAIRRGQPFVRKRTYCTGVCVEWAAGMRGRREVGKDKRVNHWQIRVGF